jgi:hypothetical protein
MHRIIYVFLISLSFTAELLAQNEAMATQYSSNPDGLYYGCGVPKDLLETDHYVALNVFNSPSNYSTYPRPITGSDLQYLGEFSNGSNCGRWLKVTMGANCKGLNNGDPNQPFCRNGGIWVDDKYSNATLYMMVADACADANAWCRDDPYHLDMFLPSLNMFEKNGATVNDMYPNSFNNRKITWEYVPAPNYSGDINIYFTVNAQIYYPAIMINNLSNGIHGIEQKVGNKWVKAVQNVDLGQQYTLDNSVTTYRIRIIDADDQLMNNGREYIFTFPSAECGALCTAPATQVNYTVFNTTTSIDELESSMQDAFYTSVEDGLLILHKRDNSKFIGGEFSLLDVNGKEMMNKEIEFSSNQKAYMLCQIKRGIYILKTKTIDGQTISKKIKY